MPQPASEKRGSAWEVLLLFLRLGCLSFGGPIAHLGYFRIEFVDRRRWLSGTAFAEIVALAQSMPGPTSSQVGFALGLLRAGYLGGMAAWTGFTLPSALLMVAFAFGRDLFSGRPGGAALHGLQLVAVAVVGQAVLAMQRNLAPDLAPVAIALAAAAIVLVSPASAGTILAIALGAVAGFFSPRSADLKSEHVFHVGLSKAVGACAGAVFAVLLLASFLGRNGLGTAGLSVPGSFFRAGALVFGGGHVVLPLLEDAVVRKGWISQPAFLSGYGAAQALPGPLFAFAAYLGASLQPSLHPLFTAAAALLAIFCPGLLLMTAVLPFWSSIRSRRAVQASLTGVNASVVGILLAALYRPLWIATVHTGADFWIVLSAFSLLTVLKTPPWMVVLGVAALSSLVELG